MNPVRVGTVEILRMRIYNLDAACTDDFGTTVIVEPGIYPLYREVDVHFWLLTGQINKRGFYRLGDGLFTMQQSDEPNGVVVTFPSKRFGPSEWTNLMSEDAFAEGSPGQRVRVVEGEVG